MNNKAQSGPVAFIFMMIFFLIFIGLIGGKLWALFGYASELAGSTGIEAFILNNFALIVVIGAILAVMSFFYFGGRQ